MTVIAYFSRRVVTRDPEVRDRINESREVIDRNKRLVRELQGVDRAIREKVWTKPRS